jgi:hypothetical protein
MKTLSNHLITMDDLMRVFFHGQSEPGPMTAAVGDVCGWMVIDFSLIPIPLLITQICTLWLVFFF